MIHVYFQKTKITKNDENIQKFAEHFVHDIIEEALKITSSSRWLRQYLRNNHQFQFINTKSFDSCLCSEFQPSYSMLNHWRETPRGNIDSLEISSPCFKNFSSEDLYTLPADTIRNQKLKKTDALEDKCFKPKAVRALNVIKSSHPRTLIDLKYLVLNLYSSSNSVTTKKIGSENSAFTKYQCENLSGWRHSTQLESKYRNRNDCLRKRLMKTETDLKNSRKCNRMKRCTFLNIKNSVCSVFRSHKRLDEPLGDMNSKTFKDRSLPPLPLSVCHSCENYDSSAAGKADKVAYEDDSSAYDADVEFNFGSYADGCMKRNKAFDFASSIEKVKDYGWYWGPMSSESAEKLLANEKDGSFIVRDSSDDRYIFSLTFKLNSLIMHVRIEHGQGNFSFGNYANFRSHTIVEFIENAVQHSKSRRYLFFTYRHPVEGPMEVQLLYPVSRFKRVQSLQHMCRFVILKSVRRDLISSLPLPKPLIEYLNCKDYYAEEKF